MVFTAVFLWSGWYRCSDVFSCDGLLVVTDQLILEETCAFQIRFCGFSFSLVLEWIFDSFALVNIAYIIVQL